MREDAKHFVSKCNPYQRFAHSAHQHPELLHPSSALWPFMKWRMDMVGPLPRGSNQNIFVLVLTDYFTKWIEAEAFAKICDHEVMRFLWKHNL